MNMSRKLIIFMSKYKYTSLLSSQYRQVFRSYHSFDRCEQELKDNLNKSVRKRIHTQVSQIQNKNELLHYQKPEFTSNVQRPDTQLYYNTQQKYSSSTGIHHQAGSRHHQQAYYKTQQLSKTYMNRCQALQSDHQLNSIQPRFAYPEKEKNIKNHQTLSNNYNNYELKTKVSQINKRRNDIKLNARAKDIDKIRNKYRYLTQLSQSQQTITNQSIQQPQQRQFNQENNLRSQLYNFESSKQFSNSTTDKQAKNNQQILRLQSTHPGPLLQANSNKLHLINNKQLKQQSRAVLDKVYQQQNIQTPHFHQAQSKKAPIQPSLISLKLHSLVKNTFTDRY